MKVGVYFKEANAGDYLAQILKIANNPQDTEYNLVLQEGDRLVNTSLGVVLVRNGREYVQKTYMASFKAVAFVEHTYCPEKNVIKAKLIKT